MDQRISETANLIQRKQFSCDISLQVTIPNEWENLAPVNIGYTAGIETTKVSGLWLEKANMMNRIIVPSNHSKNGFSETVYKTTVGGTLKLETPIDVVSFPIHETLLEELDLEISTPFNFLSVAQWSARKNLEKTIAWFVEEFRNDEDVGLILKINLANNSQIDKAACKDRVQSFLSQLGPKKCKIYLLHGNLSGGQIKNLYSNKKVKALISLSHGEGFGLPIFEAAASGLPVITTAYSGQCDFLKMPKEGKMRLAFAKVEYSMDRVQPEAVWETIIQADSFWAYADQVSTKRVMREVRKDHGRFSAQAKKLQQFLVESGNFSEKHLFEKFVSLVLPNQEDAAWSESLSEVIEL